MYVYAPFVTSGDILEDIFSEAKEKLKELSDLFYKKNADDFIPEQQKVNWHTNMAPEQFKKSIEIAKEYIKAGDIFQVVLSQRFNTRFDGESFNLYRALRIINPSPYFW